MRKTNDAPGAAAKSRWSQMPRMSYEKIAGGLASEMAECIRSKEQREFCAPFELVIVGSRGAVVFECQVGEDWKVRRQGPTHLVRRSHFPATALLTDRSQVTRTFQIERGAC
jgi:hypothetical protein